LPKRRVRVGDSRKKSVERGRGCHEERLGHGGSLLCRRKDGDEDGEAAVGEKAHAAESSDGRGTTRRR
jgi:hypothetical protein